jgi:small subunit ribosomal protein MRP21
MGFGVDPPGESVHDIVSGVQMGLARPTLPPLPPPVRLDAYIGRSEEVDPSKGVDLSTALRRLGIKLAYNNVRGDFIRQRFHERPGLKRKRLKSERWRRRFKEGFQAVCKKVQKMRRQGW